MASDPTKASYSKQVVQPAISSYNLVSHLQWTPTQISIFELLELSPLHKEILEKALRATNFPTYIDAKRFQAMVNHISSPHYLKFSKEDDNSISHPPNLTLHIEFQIFCTQVS